MEKRKNNLEKIVKESVNDNNSSRELYSDRLIESAFAYIGEWSENDPTGFYPYSISLLETATLQYRHAPSSYVYMFDEDNFGSISIQENPEKIKVILPFEYELKLEILTDAYNESIEMFQETPISYQEVFQYACYFLIEDFINFRRRKPSIVNFPGMLHVLQRTNLSEAFRESLRHDPKKMYFMPNDKNTNFKIGFKK